MLREQLKKAGYLAAAVLFVAGMSMAKSTVNQEHSREATGLLDSIQASAQNVATHADKLEALTNSGKTDWKANSDQWEQIKTEAKDMLAKAFRLEAISSSVQPWQHKAMMRTVPLVRLINSCTQKATAYLGTHHDDYLNKDYRKDISTIAENAHEITQSVNKLETRAGVRQQGSGG